MTGGFVRSGKGRWAGCVAAIATAGLLSGCAGLLKEKPQPVPVPEMPVAFVNQVPAGADLPAPPSDWWKAYESEELNSLIAGALQQNHDIKVAIARVAQADAQAAAAAGAQYPTLDATFKQSIAGPQNGIGTANSGTPFKSQRIIQGGLRANYEFDLWGKNSYAADSALALAQASVFFRETVTVTLLADLTKSYIDYLAEAEHIAVALNNLENARVTLNTVRKRMERGDGDSVNVMQQEASVAQAEAVVEIHRLLQAKAFNKIAALMGKTPSEITLQGRSLKSLTLPKLSPGIPSNLICRRPDIRRAEATLVAADADIGVARARMYPNFSFSAEAGRGGFDLSSLTSPNGLFFSIIGQVTQSIFDGGRNKAAVRQSEARYQEMVAAYAQVIVEAVHDVEDSLAELRIYSDQQQALNRAVGFAKRAYDLSTNSFDRGGLEYTTLLDTQRTFYAAQDTETGSRADRLKAAVDLFKALGGGLEDSNC